MDDRDLPPEKLARSPQQEVLEKAASRNVAQNQTGLRPDIWVHHILVRFVCVASARRDLSEEYTTSEA